MPTVSRGDHDILTFPNNHPDIKKLEIKYSDDKIVLELTVK